MKKTTFILALLTTWVVAQPGWTRFALEQVGFAVLMPEKPTYARQEDDTMVGTVATHTYRARTDEGTFVVARTRLPSSALMFGTDAMFDRAREETLRTMDGQQEGYEDIAMRGYDARRLRYSIPEAPGRPARKGEARLILVDGSLYVLNAYMPVDNDGQAFKRFFGSVELPPKS